MKTVDTIREELMRVLDTGNRAKAMRLSRQGMSVTTPNYLADWTFFRMNLAKLLVTGRDKEENSRIRTGDLEEAIQLYEGTLEHLSFRQEPRTWASVQLGLALAYDQRPIGDKEDNLKKSIRHYEESLKFFTFRHNAEFWGRIKMAIAAAYSKRRNGTVKEHFRSAVKKYKEALRAFSEESEERSDIQDSIEYVQEELAALAPSRRSTSKRKA